MAYEGPDHTVTARSAYLVYPSLWRAEDVEQLANHVREWAWRKHYAAERSVAELVDIGGEG